MKNRMKIIGGIVLAIFISGCGATGKQFSGFVKPSKNKGLIYIYRPSNFEAGALDYIAFDVTNNKKIGILQNNGYITYKTKPGKITIAMSSNPNVGIMTAEILTVGFSAQTGRGISKLLNLPDKPQKVFTVNIKPNSITCLRWSASTMSDIPNGVVDKETCKNEIKKTRSNQQ